jgi:hypothetical protein
MMKTPADRRALVVLGGLALALLLIDRAKAQQSSADSLSLNGVPVAGGSARPCG